MLCLTLLSYGSRRRAANAHARRLRTVGPASLELAAPGWITLAVRVRLHAVGAASNEGLRQLTTRSLSADWSGLGILRTESPSQRRYRATASLLAAILPLPLTTYAAQ